MPQHTSEITEGLMHLNAFVQRVEQQLPVVRQHIGRLTVLAERDAGFKTRDIREYTPDPRARAKRHTRGR